MSNIGFEIRLNVSYDEALQRATAALKDEGFGVLTTIDMKETLKAKLNADFRRYVILGACNPPLAQRALNTDFEVGLLPPCNVIVFEHGDSAVVSIVDPIAMLGVMSQIPRHAVHNPALEPIANEARERLMWVANKLAQ